MSCSASDGGVRRPIGSEANQRTRGRHQTFTSGIESDPHVGWIAGNPGTVELPRHAYPPCPSRVGVVGAKSAAGAAERFGEFSLGAKGWTPDWVLCDAHRPRRWTKSSSSCS